MQKPNHLAAHSDVEVAWWIEPTNVQFRFAGQGITIASPKVESTDTVKSKLQKLNAVGDEANPEWWEMERARLWKDVSGHLRAGFARPAPGTPLDQADRKPEEWSESIPAQSVRHCTFPRPDDRTIPKSRRKSILRSSILLCSSLRLMAPSSSSSSPSQTLELSGHVRERTGKRPRSVRSCRYL